MKFKSKVTPKNTLVSIFGMFFLAVGVITGVLLVSHPQIFKPSAQVITFYSTPYPTTQSNLPVCGSNGISRYACTSERNISGSVLCMSSSLGRATRCCPEGAVILDDFCATSLPACSYSVDCDAKKNILDSYPCVRNNAATHCCSEGQDITRIGIGIFGYWQCM